MNTLSIITVHPISRPQYMNAPVTLETFERWFICNESALRAFWKELAQWSDVQPSLDDFLAWAQCQYDIAKLSPASAATVGKPYITSHDKNDAPQADLGTAEIGNLYPVTCRPRYYDAASRILEEEGQLLTHDNADELGHVIQKWIEETHNNWEPT